MVEISRPLINSSDCRKDSFKRLPEHEQSRFLIEQGTAGIVGMYGPQIAASRFVARSSIPSQLTAGQAWEAQRLATLGLSKNTGVWRPTLQQTESAAFRVIVGEPKFIRSGLPRGTILDASQGGLLELKGGTSVLDSSYQLRLQTYRSLMENRPLTIETTRPVNPNFGDWLSDGE